MTPTRPVLLFASESNAIPRWRAEVYKVCADATVLVSFRSYGRHSCLLSQVAHWLGSSWSHTRWNPQTSKRVPAEILSHVETRLRAGEVL